MQTAFRWRMLGILCATVFVAGACGGGGGGGGISGDDTANDLVLLDLNVGDFDQVAINQVLELIFSEDLDPDTVRPETIQIRAGPQYGKQVFGDFRVDGSKVFFYPRLPVDAELIDAGFLPDTTYKVFLPGPPKVATVRNYPGDRTMREEEQYFKTATADNPDIFIDNFLDPGPPAVQSVNPVDGAIEVPSDASITLTFKRRPLHPATVNPDTIRLTMLTRKGKTFNRSVSGTPELSQTLERVAVTFVPTFPFADDAVYELLVTNRVEDLVGQSVPAFRSMFTIKDEPYRYGTFTLEFNDNDLKYADQDETTASWNEMVTDALSAIFTESGGSGKSGDLVATSDQNRTPFNTNGVDTGQWEDGVFYDVFNFRKLEVNEGVTVRFASSAQANPVKVYSVFPMKIDGTVTVSGGNGQQATSYQQIYGRSTMPSGKVRIGGAGGPGGAKGADSYFGTRYSNVPTADGANCPYGGYGGKGGKSGTYGYSSGSYFYYYSYQGGGGGGGGSKTAGDDGVKGNYPSYGYAGAGGKGGAGRAGNLDRKPNVGGAGAGAGGFGFYVNSSYAPLYIYYASAAGSGGGGGGGLWLQCASTIQVGAKGAIRADGGTGGSTQTYYVYAGGAGGGGGGGGLKVASTAGIQLATGATLSVAGGNGGKCLYTYYAGATGGDGGEGFLRLETPITDMIQGVSTANLTYTPPSIGTLNLKGGGVPSIGQTKWINFGVFDPEILPYKPLEDRVAELYNDSMKIYVQMADEHPTKVGEPDLTDQDVANDGTDNPDTLSAWTVIQDVDTLTGNGYQFARIRVVFQLDSNHSYDDPLPYLDKLDINFRY